MDNNNVITCGQTLTVVAHRIMPEDLNEHGTLFGGGTLSLVDREASLAALRVSKAPIVTAKIDHINFIRPMDLSVSLNLESYVSGFGHRSIEVFTKIIGEDLRTGKRFLAFTCFVTFVVENPTGKIGFDHLIPENDEQNTICDGYQKRVIRREQDRQDLNNLSNHININRVY